MWEWGSPVISGLRGKNRTRTDISWFSVKCELTICAISPNVRMRTPLCCKVCSWIDLLTSLTLLFLSQGNNTILSIMMEYPSRSNLKCFFSFTRSSALSFSGGDEFRFHSEESTFVEWGKPLSMVVGTGIEPVFLGWKPNILTDRWTDHNVVPVGLEPTTLWM